MPPAEAGPSGVQPKSAAAAPSWRRSTHFLPFPARQGSLIVSGNVTLAGTGPGAGLPVDRPAHSERLNTCIHSPAQLSRNCPLL